LDEIETWALAPHPNPYAPDPEVLSRLSPEKQQCLRLLFLMNNRFATEQVRSAAYEMAENRGCFK